MISPTIDEAMPRTKSQNTSIRVSVTQYPAQVREAVLHFRRYYLQQALERYGGNISRTARAIGISRRTLQLQLKEGGIPELAVDRAPQKTKLEIVGDEVGAQTTSNRS